MTFKSIETIGGNEALTKHQADGKDIVWAVIDTGIDASHDHFKKHKNLELPAPLRHRSFAEIGKRGEIQVDDDESEEDALIDVSGHGTHVAGILAGELTATKILSANGLNGSMRGVAPLARLLSVKVFSKTQKVSGTEFAVLRAMEWLLEINKTKRLIHGVLVGLALPSDVRNFACGHTPVCEAVNQLVQAGMVVVVAAGNFGYRHFEEGPDQVVYSSIADPGNAELAITVGATHRFLPHQYGASFFSSKGPTMDGRFKPDLLAPGERIISSWVGKESTGKTHYSIYQELDGTSMAAAHVAGAAAALLSVRRDLIGKPEEVKEIFLRTATDLQRTRETQGAGLLNLAKALTHKSSGLQKSAGRKQPAMAAPLVSAKSEPRDAPRLPENAAAPSEVKSSRRFVIAFSYSGKHAEQVRKIVGHVRRNALLTTEQLFYAPYYQAELSQFNLDKLLVPIYFEQSEMVVVFLGEAYQESEWCGLEWRTIIKRARKEGGTRLMLLRFDQGEVEGLKPTDGYIDIEKYMPDEVADLILDRLKLVRKTHPEP
jgi:subtilisin family serine protease